MTKQTWLKVAGSLAVLSIAASAIAADHRDGPKVTNDAPSDINDLYTFMDGDKAVLVLTVFPAAAADSKFSEKVQYIFHTTSGATFGEAKENLDIVCTFAVTQEITCLAGKGPGQPVLDKVEGAANIDAGLDSSNKMMKVYAGLRKDPFFFNLDGFKAAVKIVTDVANMNPPVLQFDAAGCPTIDAATSTLLVNQLSHSPTGMAPEDFFAPLNTMSIIIQVDKALLTAGGPIVSAWASTNMAM
jgi:hypothetical protein